MWEIDDIVGIASTCLILHKMNVRVKMNVDVRDETDGINLITKLYPNYLQFTKEAVPEYEAQRIRIRNDIERTGRKKDLNAENSRSLH